MNIVYEDKDLVVLNKPAGVDFHGENGFLNQIRQKCFEAQGVHRLDKDTSGLIIFAKGKENQSALSELFRTRKIVKLYVALGKGKPTKKQGLVKGDLKKTRNGSYKILRTLDNPSITNFESQFISELSLRSFFLRPKTGKTHQLRVVMKSLGCPIVGDIRYGGIESDRMYLHATKLEFTFKEKEYSFESIPSAGKYFESPFVLEKIQQYIKGNA